MNKIAYITTYPPRKCGIATFTEDLVTSIDQLDNFSSEIIALNEPNASYNYSKKIKFQIRRNCLDDYLQAASYINSSNVDLVNLQHEFGLYGGNWGEYIVSFVKLLEKPVLTTLHTVLPDFEPQGQSVLKGLIDNNTAIVVMTEIARQLLIKYEVPQNKIHVIPHGSPYVPFVTRERAKAYLGLNGRIVLSTHGLLSQRKGIEYAISSLPSLVKMEPRLLYLIIGETHPKVKKKEGESYRKKLKKLVHELKLTRHVKFVNRYLTKKELIRYLQAIDIYIIPYINPNQVSSGVLAYALSAGKAIISTPFLHAKEALADGRGLFSEFKDSDSIARNINLLLKNEELRKDLENKARQYGSEFLWTKEAEQYSKLFLEILSDEEHKQTNGTPFQPRPFKITNG